MPLPALAAKQLREGDLRDFGNLVRRVERVGKIQSPTVGASSRSI
jgi:hypothetical protein